MFLELRASVNACDNAGESAVGRGASIGNEAIVGTLLNEWRISPSELGVIGRCSFPPFQVVMISRSFGF